MIKKYNKTHMQCNKFILKDISSVIAFELGFLNWSIGFFNQLFRPEDIKPTLVDFAISEFLVHSNHPEKQSKNENHLQCQCQMDIILNFVSIKSAIFSPGNHTLITLGNYII